MDTRFKKGCVKSKNWYKSMEKRKGNGHSLWKGGQKTEIIKCSCGCGKTLNKFDSRNRVRLIINGHQESNYWLGKKRSSETKQKISKTNSGRILTVEHIRKSLRRREMSSLEKKVNNVIEEHRLPYRFVGNGDFFIERKNPDFINTNGKKIAVEVFYRRHKDEFRGGWQNWLKKRLDTFKKYGYAIISIDESMNNEQILNQLREEGY